MTDLHVRFTGLDEIDPPDLLPAIRSRQPRPPADEDGTGTQRRMVTIAVALLVAIAATAFVVRAFWPIGGDRYPAPGLTPTGRGDIQADVHGIVVTWPEAWTVVQLAGESQGIRPLLQLTNYQVDLNGPLCPSDVGLPADGVLLYVQRDLDQDPGSLPPWPVTPDLSTAQSGACGPGARVNWSVGKSSFQATLAVGPAASDKDVDRLIEVFEGLTFSDPQVAEMMWEGFQSRVGEPVYVVWGVNALQPNAQSWLVPANPNAADGGYVIGYIGPASVGSTSGIMSEPGDHLALAGDQSSSESPFVDSYGYVSLDVAQLVLEAEDGRVIEATIGPSLARFGVEVRPTYLQFEPPLVGTFVALDANGDVLERDRYNNYPYPDENPPPSLSTGGVLEGDMVLSLEGSLEPGVSPLQNSLVAVNPATGKVTALPQIDGYVSSASLAPGGGRLALAVYGPGRRFTIATVNADGSGFRPLVTYGGEINGLGYVAWSPDASKVAFTTITSPPGHQTEADTLTDLHIVSLADGTVTDVTQGDHIGSFSWSPDGTHFVVTRERVEGNRFRYDLFIIRPDGSEELRLTDDGMSMRPEWSTQGMIAFIGSATGEFNHRDVFVMQADGSSLIQLTDDRDVEEGLAWAPDGSRLGYVKFSKPECQVLIQTPGDGDPNPIASESDLGGGCPIDFDW